MASPTRNIFTFTIGENPITLRFVTGGNISSPYKKTAEARGTASSTGMYEPDTIEGEILIDTAIMEAYFNSFVKCKDEGLIGTGIHKAITEVGGVARPIKTTYNNVVISEYPRYVDVDEGAVRRFMVMFSCNDRDNGVFE